MISDNNSVHKKMFDIISGGVIQNSFINPFSANEPNKIFTLFDGVHIIKSIRNIWMKQKTKTKHL